MASAFLFVFFCLCFGLAQGLLQPGLFFRMDDDLPRKVLQVVRKDAVFPAAGAKRAKGVFRVDVVFEAMEQAGQPPADFRRV